MELGFDSTKTLDELEGVIWGPPTFPSYLVRTCHRLRRVPLAEFAIEDLRIMIGQQISLPFLLPIALERLVANPFAEGHFYPGDLLTYVLQVPDRFWHSEPALLVAAIEIARQASAMLAHSAQSELRAEAPEHLSAELLSFLSRW